MKDNSAKKRLIEFTPSSGIYLVEKFSDNTFVENVLDEFLYQCELENDLPVGFACIKEELRALIDTYGVANRPNGRLINGDDKCG